MSLFICHGLAVVGTLNSGLSGYLVVALSYAVLVHFCAAVNAEVGLDAPRKVVSVTGDGNVFDLFFGDGSQQRGHRLGRCCVTTWMLVFCVQSRTGLRFYISVFRFYISAFRFHVSEFSFQFPDFRFQF